jgi:hypothetical protein
LPLVVRRAGGHVASSTRHWINPRIPSWKEKLALVSQRCGRSIYTPFLSATDLES